MRPNTFVMVGLAVVFGALAVAASHSWLSSQADAQKRAIAEQNRATAMSTIVVADSALRFGSELTESVLNEIAWPSDAIPEGAFNSIVDLLKDGERVALSPVDPNEPILATKVTGPGQRATLSAIIDAGKRAVTVRVDDVNGVAGFVLPGDRVDVLMTQNARGDGGSQTGSAVVVLQGVRVLAIDQMADERAEEPDVAKAVTLEVDTYDAQKIALASSVGDLSLVLRRAGEASAEDTRNVTLRDLAPGLMAISASASVGDDDDGAKDASESKVESGQVAVSRYATIVVSAGDGRAEYQVPIERLR